MVQQMLDTVLQQGNAYQFFKDKIYGLEMQ